MKVSILKSCSPAIVALALAGCAFENAEQGHASESVGSTSQALTLNPSVFTWYQGQGPKFMTAVTNSVCFLNHVQGNFNSANEKVFIDAVSTGPGSPGAWLLNGTSASSGIGAWSYCMTGLSAGQIETDEYIWRQGDPEKNIGPSRTRACFLTRMEGRFRSANEKINLFNDGRFWRLSGTSNQHGVAVGARCVEGINYSTGGTWQHPNPTLHMGPSYNSTRACAITGISGNFGHAGSYVQVKPEWNTSAGQYYWFFRGIAQATPKSLSVSGGCIF